MIKYIFRVAFLLFFISITGIVYAQTAESVPRDGVAENAMVLSPAESELPLESGDSVEVSANTSPVFLLLKLIFFLLILSAAVYGIVYMMRRSKRFTAADDPFLKQVAALTLAPDKNLYVVTLTDKAYLIGASASSLSLISEITDKELIDAMNLHAEETSGEKQDFSSFFHTFFPSALGKQHDGNPLDSFLSKQRERLQKNTMSTEDSDTPQKENRERT